MSKLCIISIFTWVFLISFIKETWLIPRYFAIFLREKLKFCNKNLIFCEYHKKFVYNFYWWFINALKWAFFFLSVVSF
ncbi:hypothetical protein MS53_0708 [Mycoplasmopsis synoviae 53]|uniref:Uncharacterized protein n=1 Tax=Mycoplasmopsis synoviae (strain 53) TaxID=262723 RepID=A4Q809_MYCS5|nr:hypothetical protein MS53_0708 [Mycoplasmopsis synoviae 53]